MKTPIHTFVTHYLESGLSRLHMPGHKGRGMLGCEVRDITEIAGADALYAASGIVAESEKNAAALFGAGATFYAAEGSSQCVRAMLYLAMVNRADPAARPVALAARNAHKSLLYAAALCDFDVEWLFPEGEGSLCACPVAPAALAARLDAMVVKPFCAFVTSPDYLGGMQDVRGLSAVCRRHGVPLIVDNAHGAYLRFLPESLHPMDLGADMCCDSAHKTLPVLNGGAYLHVSRAADPRFIEGAKAALELFGSTSPSWLILQSLDLCNARLAGDYPAEIARTVGQVGALKRRLSDRGFEILDGEPMKLTLRGDGLQLAEDLRRGGVECEYADKEHAVLMFAPDNPDSDFNRIDAALRVPRPLRGTPAPALPRPARAMNVRQAVFAPWEEVRAEEAVGRVCAAPTASCPPAVPVAVSGETVTAEVVKALRYYGIDRLRVCK
ncbi:MAG: amino acid decarboxylase [Clostridia bacterium]|nr:amino acid decarboxylase [Clostridia bacterium]